MDSSITLVILCLKVPKDYIYENNVKIYTVNIENNDVEYSSPTTLNNASG